MKIRKALGLGLAVAVLALGVGIFASSNASAQQGPTISVSTVSANVGGQAEIQLRALNIGGLGLGAWEIGVIYNSQVVDAVTCSTSISTCNRDYAPNEVFVVGASSSGRQGNTTLATISFRCLEEGTSDLSLVVDRFADATVGAPQGISFVIQSGRITCTEPSDIPTPRRPRATDEEEEPTSTPSGGVSGLPKTGGGADGDGGAGWSIAALAGAAGLVTMTGYGALRLRARRASSGRRGKN